MSARVLIVDDEPEMVKLVADIARDQGHRPVTLTAAALALPALEEQAFDLLITDVRMPDMDGIELIEQVHAYDPRIAVIAMTAFGSIDTAVRAVRAGAVDYLPKPFQPGEMALRMERALQQRAMSLELVRLRGQVAEGHSVAGLIGKSKALEEIASLVRRVADSPVTVLITGPSGSGKELVARALHGESRRRARKLVTVNCAAIPEALLEAELFGVKRGAYTDARADRSGLFQQADGGTLFLDEIGELALPLQAKLLRVLQEREVRPVGAAEAESVDVRVVAATNRDLGAAVAQGAFREDLYYRLAVIEVMIPPLRHRVDDVIPLAEHFLTRAASRAGKGIVGFSGAAVKRLVAHDWPGNVRELQNAIERAVALCEGDRISPDDLPESIRPGKRPDILATAVEGELTIDELCREYARLVLDRCGGNKQRAASILAVDRRTLQRWFGDAAGRPGDRR